MKPTPTDPNCAYCAEGAPLDAFGIKICELPASKLYLFKEQSHRGRVIVASKFHVSEMVDLSDEDRRAFLDDVAHVARALHAAFHPKKVNYGAYGLRDEPEAHLPRARGIRRADRRDQGGAVT